MATTTGNLTNNTGTFTLTLQNNTVVTLATSKTYVTSDIELTLNVQGATLGYTGGALNSLTATASISSNITTTSTNNGISFLAIGKAGRSAVTYNSTTAGWVSVTSGDNVSTAVSAATWTGATYYISGITVPNTTGFTLTTTAGTSSLTESLNVINITNNSRRSISVSPLAGWISLNHTSLAGTDRINAYLADGTTKSGVLTLTTGGKWTINTITPTTGTLQGPFYGATYVAPMSSGTAASISAEGAVSTAPSVTLSADSGASTVTLTNSGSYYVTIKGTANNGTVTTKWKNATAGYAALNTSGTAGSSVTVTPSITNNNTKIYIPAATATVTMNKGNGSCSMTGSSNITTTSTNAYNNDVTVTFTGSGSVGATVSTTAGYVSTTSTFITGASTSSNSATATMYIKGVTLPKPSSGERKFAITVPNGDGMITFVFHVDSNGNVYVDDDISDL